MRPAPDTPSLYPGMHARLRAYHPVVTIALRLTIYLLCILGLLQLYGLNTFLWLVDTALGLRVCQRAERSWSRSCSRSGHGRR